MHTATHKHTHTHTRERAHKIVDFKTLTLGLTGIGFLELPRGDEAWLSNLKSDVFPNVVRHTVGYIGDV